MRWCILLLLLLPTTAFGKRTQETELLHEKMIEIGYDENLSEYIIDSCKGIQSEEISARHCVNRATAIGVAESSAGSTAYRFNMFGFKNRTYNNFYGSFNDRIKSYKKYWYKNYTSEDWIRRSRYCTDEIGNSLDCPNWRKNTTSIISVMADIPLPNVDIAEDDVKTVLSLMEGK